MKKEKIKQCNSVMAFGDDFGDNSTTFHCQLKKGHKGKHKEKGKLYNKYPYCITWEKTLKI